MGYYDGETYHLEDLAYVPICIIEIASPLRVALHLYRDAIALDAKVLSLEPTAYDSRGIWALNQSQW